MLDLILRNARILDGSGNPWYRGDVGIQGSQIVAVGQVTTDDAARTIDCGEPDRQPRLHRHAHARRRDAARRAAAHRQDLPGRHHRAARAGRPLLRPGLARRRSNCCGVTWPPSTATRTSAGTGPPSRRSWSASTSRSRPTSPSWSRTAPSASKCSGWRIACRRRPSLSGCASSSTRAWPTAPSGSRPASTTRRSSGPTPTSWSSSARSWRGAAAST